MIDEDICIEGLKMRLKFRRPRNLFVRDISPAQHTPQSRPFLRTQTNDRDRPNSGSTVLTHTDSLRSPSTATSGAGQQHLAVWKHCGPSDFQSGNYGALKD